MSQEQLCECGQRSGTNSHCTRCRFVSTEQSLRERIAFLEWQLASEAHGHKTQARLAGHFRDALVAISSGKCTHDSHSPELCCCAEESATFALNAEKMRRALALG